MSCSRPCKKLCCQKKCNTPLGSDDVNLGITFDKSFNRLVPVLPSCPVISHELALVDPASPYAHLPALNHNVLLNVHLSVKPSAQLSSAHHPPVAWLNAVCLPVRCAQIPAIPAVINHATIGGRRMQTSLYLYCAF
uniref:Expressed protein n=1 Tax=Echinococcus granulosus TaxID=6210 RepID=A0A068WST8_ECHGR|nr:expressed protein [Echinococcus granulosus]